MKVFFLRQLKTSGMERKCFRRPGVGPPALYTFLLGVIFIALSSSRILLVKYSANEENKYDYLPTTVNVCSELMKLILCILVSLCVMKKDDHQSRHLRCTSWKEFSSFMKWSIPAFLYFLDNLIVFYVLSYLQPVRTSVTEEVPLRRRKEMSPQTDLFSHFPLAFLTVSRTIWTESDLHIVNDSCAGYWGELLPGTGTQKPP